MRMRHAARSLRPPHSPVRCRVVHSAWVLGVSVADYPTHYQHLTKKHGGRRTWRPTQVQWQVAIGNRNREASTAGRHIYRGAKWVVLRAEGKTHPPAPLAPLSASLQSLQSRARVQAPGAPSETPDQLRRQTQTHDPDVTRDGCRLRLWPAPPPAAGLRRRSPAWPCRSPRPAGSGSRGTR